MYRGYDRYELEQLDALGHQVDDLCRRFSIPRIYPDKPFLYCGDALRSFEGVIGHALVRSDESDPALSPRQWELLRNWPPPGGANDFQVRNRQEFLSTLTETTKTFTFLLGGIAAVSLLVGGIGIMNIMLVSVTERTREIGTRKALGATRGNIMLQFLIEAVVLCMLDGAVGILLDAGGALALARLAQWNTVVSPASIILAFGFSAAVGMVFGLWPARRAAIMDPITALRYE